MILHHCPRTYRQKEYGCGFGPIHPTAAFLDYWGKCPKCGKAFKPYRKQQIKRTSTGETCKVTSVTGETYCPAPAITGGYCKRHEYLNYEG